MFTHRIVRSKNWHVRTGLPALLCLVLLSLEVGEVRAASKDLQGTWLVNANGWTFTMRLSARGRGIAGTWDALNNSNPRTLINGTVAGNRIRFTRSEHSGVKIQTYEGKLIRRARGRWMTGTFVDRGRGGYRWCAVDIRLVQMANFKQWSECRVPK